MKGIVVSISNHPLTNDIKRKVEVKGFQLFWNEEEIKIFTLCHHYDQNDNLINSQSINSYERILIANNSRFVDTDGMELDENYNSSGEKVYTRFDSQPIINQTGEYLKQFDFFDAIIKSGSIDIPTILIQQMLIEDQLKKSFDK